MLQIHEAPTSQKGGNHSYFIHTEISHQILLCEKAFRILLRPIREAKRVSHT